MDQREPSSGILVWAVRRQLQALREALTWTLDGKLNFRAAKEEVADTQVAESFVADSTTLGLNESTLSIWLRQQGLGDIGLKKPPNIRTAVDFYIIEQLGSSACEVLRSGQRSAYQGSDDFGSDRSGAGWNESINFCITSALVRLLGGLEQYEIDVVKALFYYRPLGCPSGPPEEQLPIVAEECVVREEPEQNSKDKNRLMYSKPPIWTWVRKQVENNVERRKILAHVFGIDTTPKARTKEPNGNKHRQELYEKRNAIAHGRMAVEMTLSQYVQAEVFVHRSVDHIADQCRQRHNLIV